MSIEKSITLIVVAFIATLLAWVIFSREDRGTGRPGVSAPATRTQAKKPEEHRVGLEDLRRRERGGGRRVDFGSGREGSWKPEQPAAKGPTKNGPKVGSKGRNGSRTTGGSSKPQRGEAAPTVTVRRGDSFYTIAERELGDGRRYLDIVRANPGLDPRRLKPGQTVVLPGASARSARAGSTKGGEIVASARTYEVRRGDTLSDIAKKFYGSATKWPQLLEANRDRLAAPERLRPGMVVRVP